MAKLGKDTYTINEGNGTPQAKASKTAGYAGGNLQGGGGNQFNTYGNGSQIAQQAKYDQDAIDSIVNFVAKMDEPRLKEKIQEQQLFGMQQQAKGVALEEVKKTQPFLSRFVGDTFVMEGARMYAIQDQTTKRALEIEKNWDTYKKMTPDDFKNEMNKIMLDSTTGDARADSQIMGHFMERMPHLMKNQYKDNFQYQQDELSREAFNAFRSNAEEAKMLRSRLADEGESFRAEFDVRMSQIRDRFTALPQTMTDETRQKFLTSATKYGLENGDPEVVNALLPESAIAQLPPELQVVMNSAKLGAMDNAVLAAKNDPDIQRKMSTFNSEYTKLSQARIEFEKQGKRDEADLVKSQQQQLVQEYNSYLSTKTGVDDAHSFIPIGYTDKIDLEASEERMSTVTRMENEKLKIIQERIAGRQKLSADYQTDELGDILALNGETSPTYEQVIAIAESTGQDPTTVKTKIESRVANLRAKIKEYESNYFNAEDFALKNAQRNIRGEPSLTKQQYILERIKADEKLQAEADIREAQKLENQIKNKEENFQTEMASTGVLSYKPDFSNIDQVNNSPAMRTYFQSSNEVRKNTMDVEVNDIISQINSGKLVDPQKFALATGVMVANHTAVDGDRIHSRALKNHFETDISLYNPQSFAGKLRVFQGLTRNPQVASVVRETIGDSIYERYKAASDQIGVIGLDDEKHPTEIHNIWKSTIGNKDYVANKAVSFNPGKADANGQYNWQKNDHLAKFYDELPEGSKNSQSALSLMNHTEQYFKEMSDNNTQNLPQEYLAQLAYSKASQLYDKSSSASRIYTSSNGKPYSNQQSKIVKEKGMRFDPEIADLVIDKALRMSAVKLTSFNEIDKNLTYIKTNRGSTYRDGKKIEFSTVTYKDNATGKIVNKDFDYSQNDSFTEFHEVDTSSVNVYPFNFAGKEGYKIQYNVKLNDGRNEIKEKFITYEQYISLYQAVNDKPSFF